MLRMSRKTILALEAVLDVAYNSRPNPVQSRDITRRQGIPQRYLEQVLQQLVREGVLKGVRGPRGGYVLAQHRSDVTMADVVRIVQSVEDEEDRAPTQAELGLQVITPIWQQMEERLMNDLQQITMADLCRKAEMLAISRAGGRAAVNEPARLHKMAV